MCFCVLLMAYRVVDFGVVGVLLPHLLVVLLLLHALLLAHPLQTFPPVVLLHHLVSLELVVPVLVEVLQVFGRLQGENRCLRISRNCSVLTC